MTNKFKLIKLHVFILLLFIQSQVISAPFENNHTLLKHIESIMAQYDVAAASVLLVSKDSIIINKHLGLKDRVSQVPFKSGDMYRIGSISKTFAGILAVKLQQLKLIDLNAPINDFGLSEYFENGYPEDSIKLAQLLEHTAGLKDLSKKEWDYNESKPINLKQAFDLKLGLHKTSWKPNGAQSYSNVGPGLFGLALENKLKKNYEALIQEHVLNPLQMNHTGLLLTDSIKDGLISGYDRDGKSKIPYWHNIYRPFAAINTNNKDMVKWLQMWLDDDSIFLSQQQKHRIKTPQTTFTAQAGLDYGYGLGMYQWQRKGHSFYGHGGDADGYLTRFGVNNDAGQAYFVMINAFNHKALNQMVERVEEKIIKDLPSPVYPIRLKLAEETANKYIGQYQQISARFGAVPKQANLFISANENQLSYRYKNNRSVDIHAVNSNQFRTSNQSKATMAFIESENNIYFQGDVGDFIKLKD